jgi:predicted Zn-dependent protease
MSEPQELSIAHQFGRWVGAHFTRPGWALSALRGTGPAHIEAERKWAAPLAAQIRSEWPSCRPPAPGSQVDELRVRLQRNSPIPGWQFSLQLFEHPEPYWITAPGGYLFFSRRMIDWCKGPEVFAFFLAHEMSHQMLRHSLRQAMWSKGIGVFAGVPLVGERAQSLKDAMRTAFTPEQELEADRAASMLCRRAGFPLDHILDFLAAAAASSTPLPPLFARHPPVTTRLKIIGEAQCPDL